MTSSPTNAATLISRPSGGLGRGLAGILETVSPGSRPAGPGLERLLGRAESATPPQVRHFVTDVALAVVADGFEAEAVAIARLDESGLPVVSSRLPPSWDESSSLTFALHGQLWQLLDGVDPSVDAGAQAGAGRRPGRGGEGRRCQQVTLGDRPTWLGWQPTTHGRLAAAVVRRRPFTEDEELILGRLIRSVAVAISTTGSSLPPETELTASASSNGERWRAEIVIDGLGKRRRAFAEGGTGELALARAAAKLCRDPVEVSFAGRTEIDGAAVSIVVVLDAERAPFVGLAVTEPGDTTGPVEAVFSAVSSMSIPTS